MYYYEHIPVYSFFDLTPNAQEKAVQNEYETYPDYLFASDLSELGESLLERTLPHAQFTDIAYDLSYSQGSGAIIHFKYTSLRDFATDFEEVNRICKFNNDFNFDDIYFMFACTCGHRSTYPNYNYEISSSEELDELCTRLDEYLYQETSFRGGRPNGQVAYTIDNLQKEFERDAYKCYETLFEDKDYWENLLFYKDGTYACTIDDILLTQAGE